MLFSVVMPAYNARGYIGSALESLEAQSFRNFEVVVVDDGSSDGTAAFLDSYAAIHDNVRVVHQENSGPMLARRAGVFAARGEYVLFLDADDEFTPDALGIVGKEVERSRADIVMFSFVRRDAGRSTLGVSGFDVGFYEGADYMKAKIAICAGKSNSLCSKSIKRSLFDHSDYSEYSGMRHGEDWFQLFPLVDTARSFCVIPDRLYVYNHSDQSGTSSYRSEQLSDIRVVCQRLRAYAEKWGGECPRVAARGEVLNYIYLVKISELSQATKAEKQAHFHEICCAMRDEGVFERCSRCGVRADNHMLILAMKHGWYGGARAIVRLVEAMKR